MAVWQWDVAQDDVCGICRVPFEGTCADCKAPGDDCPLSTPLFLEPCVGKKIWLTRSLSSLGEMHARLPHALSLQMVEQRRIKAAMPHGSETFRARDCTHETNKQMNTMQKWLVTHFMVTSSRHEAQNMTMFFLLLLFLSRELCKAN